MGHRRAPLSRTPSTTFEDTDTVFLLLSEFPLRAYLPRDTGRAFILVFDVTYRNLPPLPLFNRSSFPIPLLKVLSLDHAFPSPPFVHKSISCNLKPSKYRSLFFFGIFLPSSLGLLQYPKNIVQRVKAPLFPPFVT